MWEWFSRPEAMNWVPVMIHKGLWGQSEVVLSRPVSLAWLPGTGERSRKGKLRLMY